MNYQERLKTIQKAADWSQEILAARLGVTFATLNSWVNGRSQPRQKALLAIEKLYLEIVGAEEVDETELRNAKLSIRSFKMSAKAILENKQKLDALTLHLTYHTNTIEGSTMTLSDVGDVIFDHKVLANRTAVEQAEARNHQAALYWLLDELVRKGKDFVIDESFIQGIHLRLMNGIMSDAGKYRNHSVRIVGSRATVTNWLSIPKEINQLTSDTQAASTDIVAAIAVTHARFEAIHPFCDGNGRTGRLVMLAQALANGMVPPVIVKERKHAYYKYLELAQTKQYFAPLELHVAEAMQFTEELLRRHE